MAAFDCKDVFIFDCGFQVFVWIGRAASPTEKRMGIQYAQTYMTKFNRPHYLPVSRVMEGGENEIFLSVFDKNGKRAAAR
jgi:gelsolin